MAPTRPRTENRARDSRSPARHKPLSSRRVISRTVGPPPHSGAAHDAGRHAATRFTLADQGHRWAAATPDRQSPDFRGSGRHWLAQRRNLHGYVQLAAEWIVGIGKRGEVSSHQRPWRSKKHRVEGPGNRTSATRANSQRSGKFGAAVNAHRAATALAFRGKDTGCPSYSNTKWERTKWNGSSRPTDRLRFAAPGPVFEHRDMGFATRVNVVLDKAVRSPVAFDPRTDRQN